MLLINKCEALSKELTEIRSRYVAYKEMANKQMDQMKTACESVTKYRKSCETKTETNELLIQKYTGELELLKAELKKREVTIQGQNKKLLTLEEFSKKLIEKD